MSDFSFSTKTNRKLSLQTYLATFPEWSSSTRLVSLYSEFDKLKETNPFGYEANVNWWRTVILGAARNGLLSTYQPFAPSPSSQHSSQDPGSPGAKTSSKPIYEPTGNAIGILELDVDQLCIKFQKNGRGPHSLQAVMNEMNRMGEVVLRSEFLPWAGVGWTGWLFHKVVKAPLLWSLKQLSISDSSSSPRYSASPVLASTGFASPGGVGGGTNGNMAGSAGTGGMNGLGLGLTPSVSNSSAHRDTYVIVPYVQEAAARIVKLQQESAGYHTSDNLMTFAEFRQRFSRTTLLPIRGKLNSNELTSAGSVIVLTDRDLEIVIRYMQYELKVLSTGKLDANKYDNEVQDHEMVIKFATKDAIRDKSQQEITAADRGIVELRETCKRLDIQVQDIEDRISELTEKARYCVRKNQRSQATFALRQRKNLEDVLNKRLKSLDTISSILFRIQASETDAEVLQSYKLGASTLASVMGTKDQDGEQLLSRDKVESTMDRLADVFADQEEVDQAMSEGTEVFLQTTTPGGMDENELMAELDALMGQGNSVGPLSPILNNTAAVHKSASPERPIPVSRTSPSMPESEPMMVSPSRSSSARDLQAASSAISISGKRVAEIPEQAFVKQRKVSQTTVHSQRQNSDELAVDPSDHPTYSVIGDSHNVPDLAATETDHDASESATEPSRMETGRLSADRVSDKVVHEGLSKEEERDLDAMLHELEDIQVPEEDVHMHKSQSVEDEEEDPVEHSKETLVMETS
ncbi:hypothetical protein EDD11_004757 [Mortierella claussenii]|nr:hypothetical protein EDD11_004757 [Mortierella claussenii]